MINDFLQDALKLLVPENPNWYGWAKTDSDGNKIPNDQRMQPQYVIVNKEHEGKVTRPTDKEINDKIAELQDDYDSKKYQRDRKYPDLGEQFDLLFKDIDSGKVSKDGGFYKAVKAVKDAHPKPSE